MVLGVKYKVLHRPQMSKMQKIARSVVKGGTILAKAVDELCKVQLSPEMVQEKKAIDKMIDQCNDTMALLGHANFQINNLRKEFFKPEMDTDYQKLCNPNVPYTDELFGDVAKSAKDYDDEQKLLAKMFPSRGHNRGNNRGRGRGGRSFRGRGKLPRFPGGRGHRGAMRGHYDYPRQSESRYDQSSFAGGATGYGPPPKNQGRGHKAPYRH